MTRRPPQLDMHVPRKRTLSPQEVELWHTLMGQGIPSRESESVPDERASAKAPAAGKTKKAALGPQKLDKNTQSTIRKGKRRIDARLDLHGFTVEKAYHTLVQFIARMQDRKSHVVLVITGKGRAPQSGILRAQLPLWLELPPLATQVSAFSVADKVHGGEGAWYIHIRKLPMASS